MPSKLQRFIVRVEESSPIRLLRLVEAIAIVLALIAFTLEMGARSTDRAVRIATLQAQITQTLNLPGGERAVRGSIQLLIDENISMESMYLAGADLSGMNFSGVNFSQADFSNADLSRTVFTGANLAGATFDDANLSKAQIDRAILAYANFSDSYLLLTDFSNSDFLGANFRGSYIRGANFSNSNLFSASFGGTKSILPEQKEVSDSVTDFRGANLNGTKFQDADLSHSVFYGAEIAENTTFFGSNVSSANFVETKISKFQLETTCIESQDTPPNVPAEMMPDDFKSCN